MNISGYQENNFHDGSTQILGDLVIDGKLTLGGATGQSEYLDSGDYKSVISNISGITNVSFDSQTRTYYEKQGNLVKLYTTLKITFTTVLASSFQFRITVPALDIFENKINGAYCNASGSFINQYDCDSFANVVNTDGTINVIYQRLPLSNVNLPFGGDAYASLTIVYKLEGDDIPATVLIAGGSGSGDVKNPMLENLDGGGFNIVNVDTIVATNITAPNVVTNPLSVNLDANNKNITDINSVDAETLNASNTNTTNIAVDTIGTITQPNLTFSNNINMGTRTINNCSEIKTTGTTLNIIGGPIRIENDNALTDIIVNNNFDMNGRDVKDVNLLQVNTINPFNTGNITIESQSGTSKMIGSSKAIVESADDVEIICDLGSNIRLTNNLTLTGQTIYMDSNSGIIDFANANLNNVDFITNPDLPIVITGSSIELRNNPPNTGKVELYTSIDMKDNNIDNVSILTKTGAMEFKATAGYIFDNYVDFVTKRFNGIKYIKAQVDFENLSTLSGVYVIIGTVTMTEPLNITGSCLIAGYNNTSTLIFEIPTGNEITQCLRNTNNSGNIELKDFVFVNQCTSTRAGSFFTNSLVNTNILRICNVNYFNCKNNYPLRISGFELVELINCTFRYNYGGTSGPMCEIDSANNTIIESCEFYNNYQLGNPTLIYSSSLLFISGTSNIITISGNQFATYGAGSAGGVTISDFGTTNRVIIDGNVFDAEGGSDPLKLLNVDLSIHKGVVCNDNTGIMTCSASLEGLVNGNTVYTATQAGVWVPVDLTGFVTGDINRFIPGLSPYSFVYDATNHIKTLITVNCAADHSTGGTDTVRLGLSVNGTVNVFVQADLNSGQTQSTNITTVLNLHFGDTIQLVCQNLTAGTNANGFRAVSLNASLIEI